MRWLGASNPLFFGSLDAIDLQRKRIANGEHNVASFFLPGLTLDLGGCHRFTHPRTRVKFFKYFISRLEFGGKRR